MESLEPISVEDLVQEILIQAHRSKHSSLEPRALLFGITRHVAYRWIASHQHEQAALAAQQREAAEAEPYPSPEDEWQAAERRDHVRIEPELVEPRLELSHDLDDRQVRNSLAVRDAAAAGHCRAVQRRRLAPGKG